MYWGAVLSRRYQMEIQWQFCILQCQTCYRTVDWQSLILNIYIPTVYQRTIHYPGYISGLPTRHKPHTTPLARMNVSLSITDYLVPLAARCEIKTCFAGVISTLSLSVCIGRYVVRRWLLIALFCFTSSSRNDGGVCVAWEGGVWSMNMIWRLTSWCDGVLERALTR